MAHDSSGFDRKTLLAREPSPVSVASAHTCVARFQEIDAAGIVFFANIFGYFHDAYLAFMEKHGLPHQDVLKGGEWGVPIRHASADFLAPIRFGDRLRIMLVKAAWLDESVLAIGYRISLNDDDRVVAAVGRTEHVVVAFPKMTRISPPHALQKVFAHLAQKETK
jgi:1,4-dihydroxy-2-naphthoyl-CoA hydrolase